MGRKHTTQKSLLLHNLSTPSWGLLIALSLVLSLLAFWDIPSLGFDSDDQDYLKHAARLAENPSLLLSPKTAFPFGRPATELLFTLGHAIWQDSASHYHVALILLHILGSLLLYHTLKKLGLPNDLGLLSSLFFLVNGAHYQAIHWISCIAYILTFVLGLLSVIGFLNYTGSLQKRWLLISTIAAAMSTAAHPTGIVFPLFCFYIIWRMKATSKFLWGTILQFTLSLSLGMWLYFTYDSAPQNAAVFTTFEPEQVLRNFLGYLGRFIISTLWLPGFLPINEPHLVDYFIGGVFCLCALFAIFARVCIVEASALWIVLSLLPFITHSEAWSPTWPSRYFYLPSIAVSVLIAWALRSVSTFIHRRANPRFAQFFVIITATTVLLFSVFAHHRGEAITLYKSSRHHIAMGCHDVAVEHLIKAINEAPDLIPIDAYYRLGIASFRSGVPQTPIFAAAFERHPNNASIQCLLGLSETLEPQAEIRAQGEKRVAETIAFFKNHRPEFRNVSGAFTSLGIYYVGTGYIAHAENLFKIPLYFSPDDALTLYNFGLARMIQNQPDAFQYFQAAIAEDSTYISRLRSYAKNVLRQIDAPQADKILAFLQGYQE